MTDFTYTESDGMFTIFPETPAAEHTRSAVLATLGYNKLLPHEFEAFKAQAKRAGYTIAKAVPVKMSANDLMALLMEVQ